MNVMLKPELERFVTERVKAGDYSNPDEMINQALEVLKEQDQFSTEHEAYLREELRRGLEQLDRGERADFDAEKIIAEQRAAMKKS